MSDLRPESTNRHNTMVVASGTTSPIESRVVWYPKMGARSARSARSAPSWHFPPFTSHFLYTYIFLGYK